MFLEEVNEEEVLEEYGEVSFPGCNAFSLEYSGQKLKWMHTESCSYSLIL